MQTDKPDYEKLVDYIEERIVRKQLAGGDRIPSERDLSAQLGISRGAVRNGLTILEGIGIVENRHGSGNYIAKQSDRKLVQILTMMYTLDGMRFEEIRLFRYAAELQAAALAARHLDRRQKDRLRSFLRTLETSRDEGEKTYCDQMIHRTIVEASESRLVIANYQALDSVLAQFVETARRGVRKKGVIEEARFLEIHQRLVKGLCSGDFAVARQALDEHFALIREESLS